MTIEDLKVKISAEGAEETAKKVEGVARSTEKLSASAEKAAPEVDAVAEAFEELGVKSSASLKKAADDAVKSFNTIQLSGEASAEDTAKAFEKAAEAFLRYGASLGDAGREEAESLLKAQAAVHGWSEELERAGHTVDGTKEKTEKHSQSLFKTLGLYDLFRQGVGAAKDAIVTFATDIRDAVLENERLDRSLRAATGGADAFGKAQATIEATAQKLGLDNNALTETYLRLKNAGLDPSAGSLLQVATIAKALGGSEEQLADITEILAKNMIDGTIASGDLVRISGKGVDIIGALSQVMGVNKDRVIQMADAGQIGSAELQKSFELLGKSSEKLAKEVDEGLGGSLDRFKLTYRGLVDAVAKSGLGESMTRIFGQVAGEAKTSQASIKEWGTNIGGILQVVGGLFTVLLATIRSTFNLAQIAFDGFAAALANGLSVISLGISKLAEFFGAEDVAKGFSEAATVLEQRAKELAGNIEKNWGDMKKAGELALNGLVTSANGMITTFGNADEQIVLTGENLLTFGTKGKEAVDKVGAAAGAAAGEMGKLGGNTKEVEDAFATLGITSAETLQIAADKAKVALDLILATKHTVREADAAYQAYAEAAIKAAEAVSAEQVKATLNMLAAQAETDKQREFIRNLTLEYNVFGDRAATATSGAASGHRASTAAIEDEYRALLLAGDAYGLLEFRIRSANQAAAEAAAERKRIADEERQRAEQEAARTAAEEARTNAAFDARVSELPFTDQQREAFDALSPDAQQAFLDRLNRLAADAAGAGAAGGQSSIFQAALAIALRDLVGGAVGAPGSPYIPPGATTTPGRLSNLPGGSSSGGAGKAGTIQVGAGGPAFTVTIQNESDFLAELARQQGAASILTAG